MVALKRVVFVDQTGQLGGAELWLLDLLRQRSLLSDQTANPHRDEVVLFQDGPFERRLQGESYDVEVITADGGAATIRKSDRWLKQLRSVHSIRRHLRRLTRRLASADLVYANTPKAMVMSSLACRKLGTPLIYHLHDILTTEHFSSLNCRLLVRLANRYAAFVVANSQHTANAFIAAGGDATKMTVIHNGIDIRPYEVAISKRSSTVPRLRSELGLPDKPVIGVFGRLSPWKGQLIAIQAIAQESDLHLVMIGDALFGESDYVADIDRTVKQLGLSDRIHRLGFRDDIPELMQLCDVVCHCSTAPEPFGRVIVEAMMSQRPVIASNAGGAAEIVCSGKTGLLTPVGDADALKLAIRSLLNHPEDANLIAAAGRTDAMARFSLVQRTNDINRSISRVLDERLPK